MRALQFVLCLYLTACACAGTASMLGRVVYAQTADKAKYGPVEIMEKDLDTGKTTTLVPTKAFPPKLNDNTDQIAVSPDGRFIALNQGIDWDRVSREIDEAVKADKPSPPLDPEDHGTLLWDRRKGQFRNVGKNRHADRLAWSPSGDKLLMVETAVKPALVWDAAKDQVTESGLFDIFAQIAWSADGQSIIKIDTPEDGGSTVLSQPAGGVKPAKLFAWPRAIEALAVCPKGSGYTIYDGKAICVLDSSGKKLREIGVSLRKAEIVQMAYDDSGTKLALIVTHQIGDSLEDMLSGPEVERLYWAEVGTGKFEKLIEWCQTRAEAGEEARTTVDRQLVGWLPDGKSVLVGGQIFWGGEGPYGDRDDRFMLWKCDLGGEPDREKLVFDSGKGCPAMRWWAGPNPGARAASRGASTSR